MQTKTIQDKVCSLCEDIKEIGTKYNLTAKSNLPLEIKTELLNNYSRLLPEYSSELFSSLHKAIRDTKDLPYLSLLVELVDKELNKSTKAIFFSCRLEARELFDFAVDYLTSKGCQHWDFSNYSPYCEGKMISLCYYEDKGTIGISLLSEHCANRSAVLELSDRSQITTVLDILLFAVEKKDE